MKGDRQIDVVAIAGTGQNGATLASRLFGELPGCVAVGEIGRLWEKGLVENMECSCGERFLACPFWTQVGAAAFGGWDAVDGEEARRLVRALLRRRHRWPPVLSLLLIVFPRLSPRQAQDIRSYTELTRRLFDGVREVSGSTTIVDSTKWPAHVYAIGRSKALRTRVVHLIRDSRGVAYSNTKRVPRQGSKEDQPFRRQWRPWQLGVRWMWINLACHLLPRSGIPVLSLRYESLVRDPRGGMTRVADFAGIPLAASDLANVGEDEAILPPGHLVAGNRMRMSRGRVPMMVDDEWRTRLAPGQRRLVTALTWPLLRRYGYAGRSESSR